MNQLNSSEFELFYNSKISGNDLLHNNDGVFPAALKIDKLFISDNNNTSWKNIIYSGDNLEFLKTIYQDDDELVKDGIKGKVKCIYIDPPFGTGTEYSGNKGQKGYSAKVKGAEFIEFIRRRLIVAREILSDDGFIFVRQAYNFGHYIKIILDEVFGIDNFKNEIIISRKRQSMGSEGKFEIQNESLFCYSKNPFTKLKNIYTKRSLINFKWTGFLKQEVRNPCQRIFLGKELTPPDGQHFSLIQEKVDKLLKEHYLRLKCKSCGARYYFDENESGESFIEIIFRSRKQRFKYLDINNDSDVYGITKLDKCLTCSSDNFKVEYLPSDDLKLNNIWLDIPSYSDYSGYPSENSEELLNRVILSSTDENDIVMDFFGGSGSTIISAEKLKRKWIYCDFGKLAQSIVLKRLLTIKDSKEPAMLKSRYNIEPKNFIVLRKNEKLSDKKTIVNNNHKKNGDDEFSKNLPASIKATLIQDSDNFIIRIEEFNSNEQYQKKENNLNGFHNFSFALLDKDFRGNHFNIEKVLIPEADKNSKEPGILNLHSGINGEFGECISLSFYDIYGNEVQYQFKIKNPG